MFSEKVGDEEHARPVVLERVHVAGGRGLVAEPHPAGGAARGLERDVGLRLGQAELGQVGGVGLDLAVLLEVGDAVDQRRDLVLVHLGGDRLDQLPGAVGLAQQRRLALGGDADLLDGVGLRRRRPWPWPRSPAAPNRRSRCRRRGRQRPRRAPAWTTLPACRPTSSATRCRRPAPKMSAGMMKIDSSETRLQLIGGHRQPAILGGARPHGDEPLLLRQPVHRVHEQVAVALDAEAVVGGEVGIADHDHARLRRRRGRLALGRRRRRRRVGGRGRHRRARGRSGPACRPWRRRASPAGR